MKSTNGHIMNQMSADAPKMSTIFSYGTLQDPDVQMSLIGRVAELTPASITGVDMRSAYRGNFLALVPGTEEVEGSTFEVTDEELEKLDRYEGPEYKRVEWKTRDGRPTLVYMLKEEEVEVTF